MSHTFASMSNEFIEILLLNSVLVFAINDTLIA